MSLKESGEMYLECIYVLSKKNGAVRSVDIADYMGYSKPSVSRAVGLLKKRSLIEINKNGLIFLTDEGLKTAQSIFERHTVLTRMLTALGVDEQTASEDACKIEHVISQKSFDAMKKHIDTYK